MLLPIARSIRSLQNAMQNFKTKTMQYPSVKRVLGLNPAPQREVEEVITRLHELDSYTTPHPAVVEALKKNADFHKEPTDEWKEWVALSARDNLREAAAKQANKKYYRPVRPEPRKFPKDNIYDTAHDLYAILRMQDLGLKTPEQQVDFLSKVGISPGVFSLEWVYIDMPAHTFTELPIVKEHESFNVETNLPPIPKHH